MPLQVVNLPIFACLYCWWSWVSILFCSFLKNAFGSTMCVHFLFNFFLFVLFYHSSNRVLGPGASNAPWCLWFHFYPHGGIRQYWTGHVYIFGRVDRGRADLESCYPAQSGHFRWVGPWYFDTWRCGLGTCRAIAPAPSCPLLYLLHHALSQV